MSTTLPVQPALAYNLPAVRSLTRLLPVRFECSSPVIVSFPLVDEPDVMALAWTTTPWTLPSNLALCVHPAFDYVKVLGPFSLPQQSRHSYGWQLTACAEPPNLAW